MLCNALVLSFFSLNLGNMVGHDWWYGVADAYFTMDYVLHGLGERGTSVF